MLVDKNTVNQILGCLMKHPQYLSEVDKYSLTLTDFSTKFQRYIFSAILGLYHSGAMNIEPVDIDLFLQTDDVAHTTFMQNNGIEYLQDIIEFSNLETFNYYYHRLKKLNLLKDLKKQGFDISSFYVEDLADPAANEVNSKFELLSVADIIQTLKGTLIHLENDYGCTEEVEVESVADGIEDFIKTLRTTVAIGKPIQGSIYNQVIDGAQRGALTIRSGSSGLGKTRQAAGDACYLAFPVRYDWDTMTWVEEGGNEKVLFIVTEQTFVQVRKMILAYITGINESKFKYGDFTSQETDILLQAQGLLKKYSKNFTLIKMPNPTIELVKTLVRENVLTRDIGYVFYDYIFIGPSLLGEFRGFSLRNDEVLLMFATALKDLAVELNICMMTSTQVNANADDSKNIRNEASLAGGRSTINKADNGAIMARPTKEELDLLAPLTQKFGTPNMVTDIFKVRSGQWSQVRIWSLVDLGTMRKKDLFITDERLDAIEGFFERAEYRIVDWDSADHQALTKLIDDLNEGVIPNGD